MEIINVIKIEDSNLKNKLLLKRNIPALEYLLNEESKKLERLQKLNKNGKLNFGKKISSEKLKELFPKVCKEVNNFLGIHNVEASNFGYSGLNEQGSWYMPLWFYGASFLNITSGISSLLVNQDLKIPNLLQIGMGIGCFCIGKNIHSVLRDSKYFPSSERISLKKVARTNLIPVAGHEYGHHIQKRGGYSMQDSIFEEGHARGIEKYLSNLYSEKEDNEAFLYDITDKNVGEFKSSYRWLCRELKKQPRDNLLNIKTTRDSHEKLIRKKKGIPSPHAIGNSLFSIYKQTKGEDIYRQMVHGEFQFD